MTTETPSPVALLQEDDRDQIARRIQSVENAIERLRGELNEIAARWEQEINSHADAYDSWYDSSNGLWGGALSCRARVQELRDLADSLVFGILNDEYVAPDFDYLLDELTYDPEAIDEPEPTSPEAA
jgi:hypothetical protein